MTLPANIKLIPDTLFTALCIRHPGTITILNEWGQLVFAFYRCKVASTITNISLLGIDIISYLFRNEQELEFTPETFLINYHLRLCMYSNSALFRNVLIDRRSPCRFYPAIQIHLHSFIEFQIDIHFYAFLSSCIRTELQLVAIF